MSGRLFIPQFMSLLMLLPATPSSPLTFSSHTHPQVTPQNSTPPHGLPQTLQLQSFPSALPVPTQLLAFIRASEIAY